MKYFRRSSPPFKNNLEQQQKLKCPEMQVCAVQKTANMFSLSLSLPPSSSRKQSDTAILVGGPPDMRNALSYTTRPFTKLNKFFFSLSFSSLRNTFPIIKKNKKTEERYHTPNKPSKERATPWPRDKWGHIFFPKYPGILSCLLDQIKFFFYFEREFSLACLFSSLPSLAPYPIS